MHVIGFHSDAEGCGQQRVRLPLNTAMARDSSLIAEPLDEKHFEAEDGQIVSVTEEFLSADVLLLQRPVASIHWQLMQLAQLGGVAVVIDLDDDLSAVPKGHRGAKIFTSYHLAMLKRMTAAADMVTVTTPQLAKRYGSHGRVAVLPNYVPRSYVEMPLPLRAGDVIGWAGNVATHPTDLKTTGMGVGRAVSACGAKFRVIGRAEGVMEQLGLDRPPELEPWVAFDDYASALAKLDVGIAPLDNTVFNRAKSWLKPLEYASVGVPAVMSAVGEYKKLPFGIFASTPAAWQETITRMLRDTSYREHVAVQGRETVRDLYLLEDHIHMWTEAWDLAIERRRA